MKQRQPGDIWEGLFDFYQLENRQHISPENVEHAHLRKILDGGSIVEAESPVYKHILTHQVIFAVFYHVRIGAGVSDQYLSHGGYKFYTPQEIEQLPKPILMGPFTQKLLLEDKRILGIQLMQRRNTSPQQNDNNTC